MKKKNLKPDIRFTTWDDYAILSMVENGLGIGILPELIRGGKVAELPEGGR